MTKANTKIRQGASDRLFQVINYTVFTLFTLICVYPFYYIIINTISSNDLVQRGKVLFYPINIHFQNYVAVFKLDRIGSSALVSLARTLLGTLLSTMGASYMAYLFTKEHMYLRKFAYRFVVATMYFSAGLIPVYLNIRMLGLLNSFWVYVIPGIFPVYNMILVKTYMESLHPAIEESAEMDGAGFLRRFTKIVLPLCTPILATVVLFSAVGQWNSFMDTLLYINRYQLYTMQYLLYEYLNEASSLAVRVSEGGVEAAKDLVTAMTPTAVRLTVTVVATLPVMLVYPFIQKYYVKGIMIGSVKG